MKAQKACDLNVKVIYDLDIKVLYCKHSDFQVGEIRSYMIENIAVVNFDLEPRTSKSNFDKIRG